MRIISIYFGFLGKGLSGEKFLAKVRRSTKEKKLIRKKLLLATGNKKHFSKITGLEFY